MQLAQVEPGKVPGGSLSPVCTFHQRGCLAPSRLLERALPFFTFSLLSVFKTYFVSIQKHLLVALHKPAWKDVLGALISRKSGLRNHRPLVMDAISAKANFYWGEFEHLQTVVGSGALWEEGKGSTSAFISLCAREITM